MKTCKFCGKEIVDRSQRANIFCQLECSNLYKQQKTIDDWLNGKTSGHSETGILSATIRKYLINKADCKCELCGWGKENPTTHNIPLEIHHIDGNCFNSSIDNLQVLCPNCHSLTLNYKALNKSECKRDKSKRQKNHCVDCGAEIYIKSIRCVECNSKHKMTKKPVTKEELKELIRHNSFLKISRIFNVSDRSIRKWCKGYGLPCKRSDIDNISDDEWDNL